MNKIATIALAVAIGLAPPHAHAGLLSGGAKGCCQVGRKNGSVFRQAGKRSGSGNCKASDAALAKAAQATATARAAQAEGAAVAIATVAGSAPLATASPLQLVEKAAGSATEAAAAAKACVRGL